jgi:mannose-6-phosphate isomerase-like protein (cupin superfamily)
MTPALLLSAVYRIQLTMPHQNLKQKENNMSQSSIVQALYHPDTRSLATFGVGRPLPQFLLDDELKVIVAGLEPGQQIPVHPESLGMYHFLEGTGVMVVGDDEFAVEPGATVITPAGAERGMRAITRLVFLAAKLG